MSLLHRERIWPTRKTLQGLDGAALASTAAIRALLQAKCVRPPELDGRAAWGQYLDEPHHSENQWGRFGTSTAIVALAAIHGCEDGAPQAESIFASHPLDTLAPILPNSWPPGDGDQPRFANLKADDFDRVMKLAYVIDALEPDLRMVPNDQQPALVDHLVGMALPNMPGWSTRPAGARDRDRDRHLVTTYILWALRRFPKGQEAEAAKKAYFWIADEVANRSPWMGIDLVALACLALQSWDGAADSAKVAEALDTGEKRMIAWAHRQRRLALDRPYFNGFSEGHFTDYVFLTPEFLVALFLLKRGNPPGGRRFVLRTVSGLTDNIAPQIAEDDDPAKTPSGSGYRVQGGMVRTADQVWVVRLLREFGQVKESTERDLLPLGTGWITTRRGILTLAFVLAVVYTVLTVRDSGWSEKTFAALAVAAFAALLQIGLERRDGK